MSYKSILVHVEPSDAGRDRLRTSVRLAREFGARLIGMGARALNAMPDPIGVSIVKGKEEIGAALSNAEAAFQQETGVLGAAAVWRQELDFPTQALLRHACGADLVIAESGRPAAVPEIQASPDDLIMSSGLPVLALPGGERDLTKVIIGWKNTREARRAVWDALPLLVRAKKVHLVHFFVASSGAPPSEIADVLERLRFHGVHGEAQSIESSDHTVAEDLLAAAAAAGAGLIVVGGYGHTRLREWALGGVTRALIRQSSTAVLFSH
jgi:nucleotide-binding universal stress UspA family protein